LWHFSTLYILMKIITSLLISVLTMTTCGLSAQTKTDCNLVLDQEPYFAKHKTAVTDPLFLKDLDILNRCGNFRGLDSVLLKGSVLAAFLLSEVNDGKPATYRTLIDFMAGFRNTQDYFQVVGSLQLYKNLEHKKVNLQEWDQAQPFFVKLGFTQNDIDDFKVFVAIPEHQNLTYIQAYYLYMQELDQATGNSKTEQVSGR